ncbi:MAG: MBL fold metallo-hydrolase [Magnetospirillum sp.]|nr:MBL fold metallo-hydrolase [Magnetospirillum sp.]
MAPRFLGEFGDLSLSVVVTSPHWQENCYLVHHRTTGAVVIVDPGNDAEAIIAAARATGGTPLAIWLTHGHLDHLGAARAMERTFDIPTRAHADETTLIAMAGHLDRAFGGSGFEGPDNVETFDGEPILTAGDIEAKVTHTPGHTPGCVCYDFGGFALTGDTLFRQGVGRTDLPGGNEETLWASITRFLERTGDATVLFSGHGPEWTAREARRWWRTMA